MHEVLMLSRGHAYPTHDLRSAPFGVVHLSLISFSYSSANKDTTLYKIMKLV